MAFDQGQASVLFLYNPETIIKVQPMSIEQQVEHHIMTRRFDDANALIAKNQLQMSARNTPLILKAQNSQLYYCLKYERDLNKLSHLISSYLGKDKDKDRWTHWVNRLIQFKALEEVFDLLPIDQPRLSN